MLSWAGYENKPAERTYRIKDAEIQIVSRPRNDALSSLAELTACGEFAGRTEAGRHVVSRRRCQSSRRTLRTTPKRGPHRGFGSSGYLRRFCMLTAALSPLIKPYRPLRSPTSMAWGPSLNTKVIERSRASCPKHQLSEVPCVLMTGISLPTRSTSRNGWRLPRVDQ